MYLKMFTTQATSLLAKAWEPFSSPLAAPSPFLVLPWAPELLPPPAACCWASLSL